MGQPCVIDANLTLGLFLHLPYSVKVDQQMRVWQKKEAHLVVPTLWEYECVSGLRRAIILKLISARDADNMAGVLLALNFQRIGPSQGLHQAALVWAERIGQSKVYDAQYIALAESLSAEFWTADQSLFHSLQSLGVDWVHSL
jgi:predicted nucleic acid-binding protein